MRLPTLSEHGGSEDVPQLASEEIFQLRSELYRASQELASAQLDLTQNQHGFAQAEAILRGEVSDARSLADSLGITLAQFQSEASFESSAIATAELRQCEATANNLHRQRLSTVESSMRSEITFRDEQLTGLSAKWTSEGAALRAAANAYFEEAREAMAAASAEAVVRRIVDDINAKIRDINRRGAEGPPSTVMVLDPEVEVARWLRLR